VTFVFGCGNDPASSIAVVDSSCYFPLVIVFWELLSLTVLIILDCSIGSDLRNVHAAIKNDNVCSYFFSLFSLLFPHFFYSSLPHTLLFLFAGFSILVGQFSVAKSKWSCCRQDHICSRYHINTFCSTLFIFIIYFYLHASNSSKANKKILKELFSYLFIPFIL
jgi:hypothetical protein